MMNEFSNGVNYYGSIEWVYTSYCARVKKYHTGLI